MQTSGVILDFYDDSRGEMLRELCPTPDDVPEVVKKAHALSPEERQALPDDVFALVLMNGGETLRKYACTDAGNTTLSVAYFLQNAGKLPVEAQKTAAVNLRTACGWYGFNPPEDLEKIAVFGFIANRMKANPLGALQTVITAPHVARGVSQEIHARNDAVRGAPGVVTPEQVQGALGRTKEGEVSLTPLMPGPPSDKSITPSKAVVSKTAGLPHLVPGLAGKDVPPDVPEPGHLHAKQPGQFPQMRLMHPHVDVTHKQAPVCVEEKKAEHYALHGRYPLDGYDQIKAASAYFEEWGRFFSPEDRHEYCKNMLKRADAVGISVSLAARKYGSTELAGRDEIKMAFDQRRALTMDEDALMMLGQLERIACDVRRVFNGDVKTAAVAPWCDPMVLIGALDAFDKAAGLDAFYDRDLMDPYFCLLGIQKSAEEDYTFINANDSISGPALRRLSVTGEKPLGDLFGCDLAKEFRKDPIAIFKSLPLAQKKVVMRMAASAPATVQEE